MGDEAQLPADGLIQPLLCHQKGNLVQGGGGGVLDDAVRLDVAEQSDLFPHVFGDGSVAAADQNVRLDTQGEQLLYGVLGGLGL